MLIYPDNGDAIKRRLQNGATLTACLCALRCHHCPDWWKDFAATAPLFPHHCFVWLDVDDHPDLVADIPGLTGFPFLLVQDDSLRFLGVIAPDRAALIRLLQDIATHPPATTVMDTAPITDTASLPHGPKPALKAYLME